MNKNRLYMALIFITLFPANILSREHVVNNFNLSRWYTISPGGAISSSESMRLISNVGEVIVDGLGSGFHCGSGYHTPGSPTPVTSEEEQLIPKEFSLGQNFPNPFNLSTTVQFNVPRRCFVTIKIYNILGQNIRDLTDNWFAAGTYQVFWNGTNNFGEEVSSGIYLYRIEAGEFVETRKMTLLK